METWPNDEQTRCCILIRPARSNLDAPGVHRYIYPKPDLLRGSPQLDGPGMHRPTGHLKNSHQSIHHQTNGSYSCLWTSICSTIYAPHELSPSEWYLTNRVGGPSWRVITYQVLSLSLRTQSPPLTPLYTLASPARRASTSPCRKTMFRLRQSRPCCTGLRTLLRFRCVVVAARSGT